eukprot:14986379-Alexandrium_andersonii.AAC.1
MPAHFRSSVHPACALARALSHSPLASLARAQTCAICALRMCPSTSCTLFPARAPQHVPDHVP